MPVNQTIPQTPQSNVQVAQMQTAQQPNGMPPTNQGVPGQMMPNEEKKSIFKKWWFWVIVTVLLVVIGFGLYAVFTA